MTWNETYEVTMAVETPNGELCDVPCVFRISASKSRHKYYATAQLLHMSIGDLKLDEEGLLKLLDSKEFTNLEETAAKQWISLKEDHLQSL